MTPERLKELRGWLSIDEHPDIPTRVFVECLEEIESLRRRVVGLERELSNATDDRESFKKSLEITLERLGVAKEALRKIVEKDEEGTPLQPFYNLRTIAREALAKMEGK